MSRAQKIGIAALALMLALWFPPTRAVILFALPLGKGVDDFIAIVALWIGTFLLAWDRFFKGGTDKQKFIFALIMTIATGLFVAWLFVL